MKPNLINKNLKDLSWIGMQLKTKVIALLLIFGGLSIGNLSGQEEVVYTLNQCSSFTSNGSGTSCYWCLPEEPYRYNSVGDDLSANWTSTGNGSPISIKIEHSFGTYNTGQQEYDVYLNGEFITHYIPVFNTNCSTQSAQIYDVPADKLQFYNPGGVNEWKYEVTQVWSNYPYMQFRTFTDGSTLFRATVEYGFTLPGTGEGSSGEDCISDLVPETSLGFETQLNDGGVFSGPGVTDNGDLTTYSFDPQDAAITPEVPFDITYTPVNITASDPIQTQSVTVFPEINFPALSSVSPDLGPYVVNGGALPVGGVYSGPGVTDNGDGINFTFDPTTAGGEGTYTISYDRVCMATQTITVANFTAPDDICIENDNVLSGLGGGIPEGGVYSGPGVTDDGNGMTYSFDPSIATGAGIGAHTITYTEGGTAFNDVVEVFSSVTFDGEEGFYIGAGVQTGLGGGTPSGGEYSGPGVTDDGNGLTYTFNPALAGAGSHTVTYDRSCMDTKTLHVFDFTVPEAFCVGESLISGLGNSNPSGGEFTGLGVFDDGNGSTFSFDPSIAGLGFHDITYTLLGVSASVEIEVVDMSSFSIPGSISLGDIITLDNGIPSGGTYSGPGVIDDGMGNYSFDTNVADVGSHTIMYEVNGCSYSSQTISVFPFEAITFTNAGQTGRTGPTQSQINNAYVGTDLEGEVTINTQGIQEWEVPNSGTYRITALGATGGVTNDESRTWHGDPGTGATIAGDFYLEEGTILKIVVGQQGSYGGNGSSGGGGTFIFTGDPQGDGLLIAAGGGGGWGHNSSCCLDEYPVGKGGGGSANENMTYSQDGSGNGDSGGIGEGGLHGERVTRVNNGQTNYCHSGVGAGGMGWNSDGQDATDCGSATGGNSLTFEGGTGDANGGFGGGGGETGSGDPGGGAGGYTGGGGGNGWTDRQWGAGAGGGSFNTGINQTNIAGITGAECGYSHGFVTISVPNSGEEVECSENITVSSISSSNVSCPGAGDGSITVSATTTSGNDLQFSLDGGQTFVSGCSPFTFTNQEPGDYDVVVSDGECQSDPQQVVINSIAEDYSLSSATATDDMTNGLEFTLDFTHIAYDNVSPTNAVSLQYYFSTDATYDGGDASLGTATSYFDGVTFLEYSESVTLPEATTDGTYYIIIRSDYDDQENECNETNNTAVIEITVVIPEVSCDVMLDATSATMESCSGASDGSITITASSSNSMMFSIDGGATYTAGTSPFTFSDLSPDIYMVMVRDVDDEECVTESTDVEILSATAIDYYGADASTSVSESLVGAMVDLSFVQHMSGTPDGDVTVGASFYLSSDEVLDEEDVELGTGSSILGNANASNTVMLSAIIPVDTEVGSYYILFATDAEEECNANNNLLSLPFDVVHPDYQGTNASLDAVESYAAASVTASCVQGVVNGDLVSSVVLHSAYYFSEDAIWDLDDISLATDLSTLSVGDNNDPENALLTIPEVAPGDYYVLIVTDPDDLEVEHNENNNINALSITILDPEEEPETYDEFYLQNASLDKAMSSEGESVRATVYQWYDGTTTSNQTVKLAYYFSTDNVLDTGVDELIGTDNSTISLADLYDKETLDFIVPNGTPLGMAYVFFVTDYTEDFEEMDEGNNVAMVAIEIFEDDGPSDDDFYISNASVSNNNPMPGESITMDYDSYYSGSSSTSLYVKGRYYLSTDDTYENGDVYLGVETSSLSASDLYDPENKTSTIPASTTEGEYFILFITDFDEDHAEIDETNNLAAIPITVGDAQPLSSQASEYIMTEDIDGVKISEDDIDDDLDKGVTNNLEVNVFPNPASDYISIGGLDVKSFASVIIINNSGQIIRTILIDEVGSSTNHIDISNLSNGMYYILLRSERKELNKRLKFIKM